MVHGISIIALLCWIDEAVSTHAKMLQGVRHIQAYKENQGFENLMRFVKI